MSFEDDVLDIVKDRFDIDDVFNDDQIIDYVRRVMDVTDVFETSELENWALDNGFVRGDDNED